MRRPAFRKLARRFLIVVAVLMVLFAIAAVAFTLHCAAVAEPPKPISDAARARRAITTGIKDYARTEDDTYLTYPEWYIVWSYTEKADFQEHKLPSGFSYFGAIHQYWSGYCCTYGAVKGKYPFNVGTHVMLAVIGTSFSMEYILKGLYENTIGRLSEWTSSHEQVDEDRYAYGVARAYANFVHARPFYEFSFSTRLPGLWTQNSWWGSHPLRKWERKIFLTVDYAAEAFYCSILELMTHASYGYESNETFAWITDTPADLFAQNPVIRNIKQIDASSFIVSIPRYQDFTVGAISLAARNVRFVEIAGNDEIMLTVLAPATWTNDPTGAKVLFSAAIPTQPDMKRVALVSQVSSLHKVLNDLSGRGVRIEHIYDY